MSGAPLDITHFKESGDVYPHDSDGLPADCDGFVSLLIYEVRDDWRV